MRNPISVLCLLLVLSVSGCQGYRSDSSRTPGEFTDDVAIQTAVKTALVRAEGVGGRGINVEVRRSVVTLYGRVGSDAERNLALQTAREVGGVASVVDRLTLVKPD